MDTLHMSALELWGIGFLMGLISGYIAFRYDLKDRAKKYGVLDIGGMKFVRHWED